MTEELKKSLKRDIKQAILSRLVVANKGSIETYAIPEVMKVIEKYYPNSTN